MKDSENLFQDPYSQPQSKESAQNEEFIPPKKEIADSLPPAIFATLESAVYSTAISPDGRQVIAGLENGTLHLFNLMDGSTVGQPFTGHTSSVSSVAFSPDGKSIVSGSSDNTIRLWSLDGSAVGRPFTGHTSSISSVAFSPDGKSIVSGSLDNTLRLWALDGSAVESFTGHTSSVSSVAFSPDGKSIVSSSQDRTLRLWSLDGNQMFMDNTASACSVAFSPDGKLIVIGSYDNTLRLLSLDGSAVGEAFTGHLRSVSSVAFSPDGKSIVSGSADKTLRLWVLDSSAVEEPFTNNTGSVLVASAIKSLSVRIEDIFIPQGIKSDRASGKDALDVKDEINALTEVLLQRSLMPPVAVGILGNWGSGKSFGMHLIQSQIKNYRRQNVTALAAWGKWRSIQDEQPERMSPFVGHIYQIQFNAWTYAKSNLWASLMQEIFYELNRQITLEQKLARFLSGDNTPVMPSETPFSAMETHHLYTPYKSFNRYIRCHYHTFQSFDRWLTFHISTRTLSGIAILDLVFWQITLHGGLLIYLLLHFKIHFQVHILLQRFYLLLKLIIISRFKEISLLEASSDFSITFVSNWEEYLEYQYYTYYFPALSLPNNNKWDTVLNFIEHGLFLLFDGFPKRIRDRKKYWKQRKEAFRPDSIDHESQRPTQVKDKNPASVESFKINQALRKGGDLWQILYELNKADTNKLLEQKLSSEELKKWNNLKPDQEISNVLWSTLDSIQQKEAQNFKTLEFQLQEAEKTLERKRRSNELNINQTLFQRKLNALWTPFFNGIARLKFSKEEIETFSASGKSFQKFRETMTSWQGLLALFCMGLLIAITVSPEGREPIIQLLQAVLSNPILQKITQKLPGLQNIPSHVITLLDWAKNNIHPWFQIGSATLIGLIPVLKAFTTYIDSVQKEQARIQGERDVLLQQSQIKAESEVQEVAQLRLKVEEERRRLGPNAQYSSLLDFVNARLSGDDYGKHLGLMQQVKQDLSALSARLTLNKGNEKEIQKLFPRGPARVFLYIDDLDRCPPDRVVEVLEAVQLLLNTELFVVVLAIDDRYIARALEQVYEGVLKRRGKPSGIDYLEKIIQIPYRMRPISPDTVANYLRSQLTIKSPESSTEANTSDTNTTSSSQKPDPQDSDAETHHVIDKADSNLKSEADNAQLTQETTVTPSDQKSELMEQGATSESNSSEQILPNPDLPQETSNTPPIAITGQKEVQLNTVEPSENNQETRTDRSETDESTVQAAEPQKQEVPAYHETIATVEEFNQADLDLLVDCCKYVDITPRTGKRLINIYKILQIIWKTRNKEKSHPLPTDFTQRVVMSFLALSGRYPDFMRSLFDEIDMRLETKTFNSESGETLINPAIPLHLSDIIAAIQPQFNSSHHQDFHSIREWQRFESDITGMLKQLNPDFTLDRRTFSLMLSFCFVGDLGYDPDDFQPTPFSSPQP